MSATFADTFRDLVTPGLRRSCRLQALAVARGRCGFSDGCATVMREALARGAAQLPGPTFQHLIDWVNATVLKTVCAIEADESVARQIIHEIVPLEPVVERIAA